MTEATDAPVDDVAIRTLRKRLEAVWSELSKVCGPRHEAERIHQLRVATRRTIAAIDAFDDLLPGKVSSWFEKQLRRIRRAAGNARDLDVLTDRLRGKSGAVSPGRSLAGNAARRRLIAMLSLKRADSRQPIHEVREKLSAADWHAQVERLLDAVAAGRGHTTFRQYARRRFKPLMRRFFARADRRLRDAEEIHRLRIEGKKLRYALEIFAAVFPERVRVKCEKSLELLQENLGEFTDHAAAADRLERWARQEGAVGERKAIGALRKIEAHQADQARRTFVKWWSPARRRSLRRRFEHTLRKGTA
ncbi:MAG: CHAD domain-containing protein [Planctomycetia bacterium]|nr:CHAD domain-containing protein [Planctomycetia bacterium]